MVRDNTGSAYYFSEEGDEKLKESAGYGKHHHHRTD